MTSIFDEETDSGGEHWTVSDEGLDEIFAWCKFRFELAKIMPNQFEVDTDNPQELDQDYKVALLMLVLLEEEYNRRGKELPFRQDFF